MAEPLASWRNCVFELSGLSAEHPLDLAVAVTNDPSISNQELAFVDLACKDQSRLVDSWAEAEAVLQQDIIEANALMLDDVLAVQILAIELTGIRDGLGE